MPRSILPGPSSLPPQNRLSYLGSKYHRALSISCNNSVISGIGYTIHIVSWLTRLSSIHNRLSSPFFLMTITISEAQGDVDGRMIMAENNPLIRSANFSRNLGATGLTRCEIGLDPQTSMSQRLLVLREVTFYLFLEVNDVSSKSIVATSFDPRTRIHLDFRFVYHRW